MKRFKVVAYKNQRYEMEVEAEDEDKAKEIAEGLNEVSPLWKEDIDYNNFFVDYAEEVTEEVDGEE